MNDAVELDLHDMSAQISSLNKSPAAFIQEYAAKNHLVLKYDLIHNGIFQSKVYFKYSVTLDGYKTVGEGTSKKEAKQVVAFKLLNLLVKDKPELLNTDCGKHVVAPTLTNTIELNQAVGQLNGICTVNKLRTPEFNLVCEEGQSHAKLFTVNCQVSEMIETATHNTKKQAKNLAALKMVKKLMSNDNLLALKNAAQKPDSFAVLKKVEMIKLEQELRKNLERNSRMSEYHLRFKKTEWPKSDTFNDIMKQFNQDKKLDFADPCAVLKQIVLERKMFLVEKYIDNKSLKNKNMNFCVLSIENVYPPVYGIGLDLTIEKARVIASTELLKNICILSM